MNEKEDKIIEVGIVKTTYPNAEFNVEIQNGHLVRAGICGKMRKSHFKIIPGDRVKIEISIYDLNKGRIIQRLNQDFSEIPIVKKQSFKKGSARRRKLLFTKIVITRKNGYTKNLVIFFLYTNFYNC